MHSRNEPKLKVDLYCATIPGIKGLIAAHYWLVIHDNPESHRLEVWQTPKIKKGSKNIGHICHDLMSPTANVGGGPTKLITTWSKEEAERIQNVIENIDLTYPYCHWYRPWPGPNSNTFIAWILQKANIKHNLGWNALGKHFSGT